MDVGELLSYQPNRGTKRPQDDEEEELKMRRRQAGTRERGRYREEEMTVVEEADDDKNGCFKLSTERVRRKRKRKNHWMKAQ